MTMATVGSGTQNGRGVLIETYWNVNLFGDL